MNMSPAVIVAQVVLTALLAVQPYAKNRFAFLLLCTLGNLVSLLVYWLNGDMAASLSLVLINVRSVAYLYQGRAKTDLIPFVALAVQAAVTVPTLGAGSMSSPIDFLPVALPLYATWFFWWSKNLQHMRVHTAVNDTLWGIYDLATGLPIAGITDFVTAGISLSAFVVRGRNGADEEVAQAAGQLAA